MVANNSQRVELPGWSSWPYPSFLSSMPMLGGNDFFDAHRIFTGSFSNNRSLCLKMYPLSIFQFLNCPTNFGICRNSMLWSHLWHHNLTMDSFWTMYSGRIAFGCQKQFLRNPKYFSMWYSFLESTFLVWLSGMFLIPCSHTLFVLYGWIFTGMKNCSIVMLFPDMV